MQKLHNEVSPFFSVSLFYDLLETKGNSDSCLKLLNNDNSIEHRPSAGPWRSS